MVWRGRKFRLPSLRHLCKNLVDTDVDERGISTFAAFRWKEDKYERNRAGVKAGLMILL